MNISGSVFIVKMPNPTAIVFAAVKHHSKDPNLWFFVPGDDFSLIAKSDVASNPWNWRCNHGIWIHTDDINSNAKLCEVDSVTLLAIQEKLEQLTNNPIELLNDEMSFDPDYQDWIVDMQDCLSDLRDFLHNENVCS